MSLTVLKTYYKGTVIKTMCCCHQDRQIDQWKEQSAKIDLLYKTSWFFDKSAKAIQQGKDIFSTNCSGKTGHSHEKNETRPLLKLIPYTKT